MNKIDHQIGVGDLKISNKQKEYVNDVLNSNRLSYGKYLSRYESEFAKAHNAKYAISCNSGTDALRIAIACLKETEKWKEGDEVIVPALTFVATVNIVIQNGLKPVFVDVEPEFYGINPALIEQKITPRTKAIIPVHLFGMPCEMDEIIRIAKKHNLKIVEDSCETMFARYNEQYVGTFGEFGCFSSYICHVITTGVGGMITTNNPEFAIIARSSANHGRDSIYINIDDDKVSNKEKLSEIVARRFKFERIGYSSRLTEMEGALGLAQIEEREDNLKKRQRNADFLISKLNKFSKYLQLPQKRQGAEHVFMMFPIVIKSSIDKSKIREFIQDKPEQIDIKEVHKFLNENESSFTKTELVNFLEENNIETRDMLPLVNQPIYKKLFGNELEDKYPVAKWINNNGFYMGCYPTMTEEEKEYIVLKFEEFFKKKGISVGEIGFEFYTKNIGQENLLTTLKRQHL